MFQETYEAAANGARVLVMSAFDGYVPGEGEVAVTPVEGTFTLATDSPKIRPKLSYRYGDSSSLCEFFLEDSLGFEYVLPNTVLPHFSWTGLAVMNPGDQPLTVRLNAYRDGELRGETVIEVEPHTKYVRLSDGVWPGLGYAGFDQVNIRGLDGPIPPPMNITGNDDQDRHVFFNGAVTHRPAGVSFDKSPQFVTSLRTHDVSLGDVDGDGDLDAVLSNMGEIYSQVLLNDGTGWFTDSGQNLTWWGHGAGLGDLDGDGDPDLVITCANYSFRTRVYFNDGTGTFTDSGQDLGDTELSGNGVSLADVDGDGDLDCYIVYYQSPNKLYLNDGTGSFVESGFTVPADHLAFWADLDADGDVDIFLKEVGWGYRIMLNDGQGGFSEAWQHADSDVVYGDVALGDIDDDGDVDAIVANGDNAASHETRVFLNDGNGVFAESADTLGPTFWAHLALGDLDRDGDVDVFITNLGPPNTVWLNDGSGRFVDSGLRLSAEANNSWCSLGDLDIDGDLDVFIATFIEGPNEVWFNTIF